MGKLSKRTKWSYCIGATGRDAAYTLVSMFLLTYIQYTMKLSVSQFFVISVAMVICMVWDAVNDLMMSTIIENSHYKSGKYRPFIIVGAIFNAIIIVLMFTIRPDGWAFVFFFSVCYLLWGMTYTVNDIAYWGMLPSLTSDKKERDDLVTTMGIFVCIGQFLVAGVIPIVIAGNAISAFRISALIIGLGFIIFQLVTYLGVTENKRSDNSESVTLKNMIYILKRNDQLLHSGVSYILFCVGQNILFLLAVNFFYFEFGYSSSGDLITIFTVMYGLGTLVSQFIYPVMSAKLLRKQILKICISVLVLSYIVFLGFGFVTPKYVVIVYILGFIIFFCQGIFNLALIVMINNTIEYDELKHGERHDSIISAIRSFGAKLSGAINQGIASLILIVSGIYSISQNISKLEIEVGNGSIAKEEALTLADKYILNVSSVQTLILRIGMVGIPIITIFIAYYVLKKKYTIDEMEYERIIKELEEKQIKG